MFVLGILKDIHVSLQREHWSHHLVRGITLKGTRCLLRLCWCLQEKKNLPAEDWYLLTGDVCWLLEWVSEWVIWMRRRTVQERRCSDEAVIKSGVDLYPLQRVKPPGNISGLLKCSKEFSNYVSFYVLIRQGSLTCLTMFSLLFNLSLYLHGSKNAHDIREYYSIWRQCWIRDTHGIINNI